MRVVDSKDVPIFQVDVFDLGPWASERAKDSLENAHLPPTIQRQTYKLSYGDAYDNEDMHDKWYDLVTQDIRPLHHRGARDDSITPKDKSVVGAHSSFSTKILPSSKRNLGRGRPYITDQFRGGLPSDIFLQHPASQSSILPRQSDPITQICDATHHEEIFDILDRAGCPKMAMRLRYLHETAQDDDPDDPGMELMSLRKLASFFTGDDVSLPNPRIGISHDGFLQVEWYSRNAAALMNFMPDGNIVIAATITIDGQDGSQDIHGICGKELALQVIRLFINQPARYVRC